MVDDDSPTEVWVKNERGQWCFRAPETGTLVRRTWQAVFVACRIPMEYLEDDELAQCALRANITGSLVIPRQRRIVISPQAARARKAEMMRRSMEAQDALISRYLGVFEEIALDTNADAQHRLRAAEAALDRIIGKASQKVEVNAQVAVWEQGLGGLLVGTGDATIALDAPANEGDT